MGTFDQVMSGGGGARAPKKGGAAGFVADHTPDFIADHLAPGSVGGRVLGVIDLPRSAAVGGIHQLGNALMGKPASGAGWWQDIKSHRGFGQVIQEWAPNQSPWLKDLEGFVGDVGLDPLTYFAGAGAIKDVGVGAGATGRTLGREEMARLLAAAGERDAADVVLRTGANNVPRDVAERAGVTTGYRLRAALPGGRDLNTPMFGRELAAKSARAKGAVRAFVGSSDQLTRIQGAFHYLGEDFVKFARREPFAALEATDQIRSFRAAGKVAAQGAKKDIQSLYMEFKDLPTNVLRDAIEGLPTTDVRATEAATRYQKILTSLADAVEEETGISIPRIENYLPHMQSDEWRQFLVESGKPTGKDVAGFLKSRGLKSGDELAGRVLENGSVSEIHEVLLDHFGPKFVGMFDENPWSVATRYADYAGRSISRDGVYRALTNTGEEGKRLAIQLADDPKALAKVASDRFGRAVDKIEGISKLRDKVSEKVARSAAKAEEGAAKFELRQEGRALKDLAKTEVAPEIKAAGQEATGLEKLLPQLEAKAARVARTEVPTGARDKAMAQLEQALGAQSTMQPDALATVATDAATQPGLPEIVSKGQELKATLDAKVEAKQQLVQTEAVKFSQAQAALGGQLGDLTAQIEDLQVQLTSAQGAQADAISRRLNLLQGAQELEAAAHGGPQTLSEKMRLQSVAMRAESELVALDAAAPAEAARWADDATYWADRLKDVEALDANYQALTPFATLKDGAKLYADQDLANALIDLSRVYEPGAIDNFFRKTVDPIMNRWKAYSILSPGFHMRNALGGIWNNAIHGVKPSSYRAFGSAFEKLYNETTVARVVKWGEGGGIESLAGQPERVQTMFRELERRGLFEKLNIHDVSDIEDAFKAGSTPEDASRLRRAANMVSEKSKHNKLTELNYAASDRVETHLRGAMFYDDYVRLGKSADESWANVLKYHFDYDELGRTEAAVMKRLFPFYTWTKKNFPLQIELMARQPAPFRAYLAATRNIELNVPAPEVTPDYYKELTGVRTPFNHKGDRLFLTPDLPFNNMMSQVTNPVRAFGSQMTPLTKMPLELFFGSQFFTDKQPFNPKYVKVPHTWLPVALPMAALDKLGLDIPGLPHFKYANGDVIMNGRDAYKMEQYLPTLGKARRTVPYGEKDMQDRLYTSWLSFAFGISARTLTQEQVKAELRKQLRSAATEKAVEKQIRKLTK